MPASTVCVQVGQCGNQVGEAYFDQLSRADDGETFFRERARGGRTARAVLVDTEPRVSSQCVLGARGGWHYDRHGHVIGGDGALQGERARLPHERRSARAHVRRILRVP